MLSIAADVIVETRHIVSLLILGGSANPDLKQVKVEMCCMSVTDA